jgi:hypothetical protein
MAEDLLLKAEKLTAIAQRCPAGFFGRFGCPRVNPDSFLPDNPGKAALTIEKGLPLLLRVDQQIRRHGKSSDIPKGIPALEW